MASSPADSADAHSGSALTGRQHAGGPRADARRSHRRRIDGRLMDYTSPTDMASAAETQRRRRGSDDDQFVVATFVLLAGAVCLAAVERSPAYDLPGTLTTDARRFNRWRTKQAAWAWLQRHPSVDARVIHLGRLDVLPPPPLLPRLEVDAGSTDQAPAGRGVDPA